MNLTDNRRKNLKRWFSDNSVPAHEKSYISQLISGKASFGEKAARRLEDTYGMGSGYLDAPIDTSKHDFLKTKKQQHPLIQQIIALMESTDDQGKQLVLIRAEEIIAERRAHLRKIMMVPPLIPMETSALIERTKTKVEEK